MKLRRRLITKLLIRGGFLGWMGSIFYPTFAFLKPPKTTSPIIDFVVVSKVGEFATGEWRIIKYGRQPVIVIRLGEKDFRAFSAVCTHLSCIVQYRSDLSHIWCACHNGHFDLKGRNIAGPPPRPLEPYFVSIVDENVVVFRDDPEP